MQSIPPSWPLVPLGSICQVGAGNGAPQGEAFFAEGTYPFVRTQDVGRCANPYLTSTVDRLNDLALEKHSLRLWPEDSLLIPKSGASVALNKRALLGQPSYVVSHLAVLVPGPLIDPVYLYYLSCTLDMMRLALDPGYPSLRTSDLGRLRIPLPPLGEQQRIVEIMQEAEAIRSLRAEADAAASALVPAMFFERFSAEAETRFIPLHRLAEVVSGVAIGRRTKGMTVEVPYLRVANVQAGYVDLTEVKSTPATEGEVQQFGLKEGDVLLTEGGDFDKLGRGCLWEGQVEPCIHQNHVFRVRPDTARLNSRFFAHYLQSAKAKSYFLRCAKKTTNLASINLSQLKQLPVPDVPLEDQLRFEEEIRVAQECGTESSKRVFQRLVRSLSAHAFSGQLTADWRESNHERLAAEARERDQALHASQGRIFPLSAHAVATSKATASLVFEDHADGIHSDLNREQRFLFREIKRMVGGVSYIRYFNAKMLGDFLRTPPLRKNPQAIEGHLTVLAARGLLIPVSREEQTADTGEYLFGNAYRLVIGELSLSIEDENGTQLLDEDGNEIVGEPLVGDRSRLREMERLIGQLEKERAKK